MGIFDQSEFDVRCEWGVQGVARLTPISDAVIIVDVLSFSTCVDIATGRGATVYTYEGQDGSAAEFAASIGAELAGVHPGGSGYALSPQSLVDIPPGTRLVLPSPNGSTLTLKTGETPTLAGCLRNCGTVAAAAQRYGRRIAIIPAGERWWDDRSLRPAFEDMVGAGAIISFMAGTRSPEAQAAVAVFQNARSELERLLAQCGSGQELIDRARARDVVLAAQLNVSTCAPLFRESAYVRSEG